MVDLLGTLVQFWVSALISVVLAIYWKHQPPQHKPEFSQYIKLFFFTWGFVFLVSIPAQFLIASLGASEEKVHTFGWFLIPLVAGVWFARIRLAKIRATTA